MIARTFASMGRIHLEVQNVIVATQGDLCRDPNVPVLDEDEGSEICKRHNERCWTAKRLEWARDKINFLNENLIPPVIPR